MLSPYMNMTPKGLLFVFLLTTRTCIVHAWTPCSTRLFAQSVLPSQQQVQHAEVLDRIANTDRGRSVSSDTAQELDSYFQSLEGQCSLPEPARSPWVEGNWIVEYTTAPPPSNGQLGPFRGIAYQEVNLETKRYANILKVQNWLSATLEATWEEWDGAYLKDGDTVSLQQKSSLEDAGATCWVVTFENLTIEVFGIPLFTQTFKDTKRVWRTTYVDENTRIVRAGRTGKQEDEMFFYMTRCSGENELE